MDWVTITIYLNITKELEEIWNFCELMNKTVL